MSIVTHTFKTTTLGTSNLSRLKRVENLDLDLPMAENILLFDG